MKELRVYIVNIEDLEDKVTDRIATKSISNDEFMDLAEQQGTVYTLDNFVDSFNYSEDIDTYNSYIRIIEVETNL